MLTFGRAGRRAIPKIAANPINSVPLGSGTALAFTVSVGRALTVPKVRELKR